MRWYLDEHVDMLFGQNARDDLYPQFSAPALRGALDEK
jgi:hypothetical protein